VIVQELQGADGETTAFISRNAYGALVLNARDLMFIDIDFPLKEPAAIGLLKRLFGQAPAVPGIEEAALDRVRSWCDANVDVAVRIYRTAAGLRVLIVDRPMAAGGDDARRILDELGSDPLYRRMCDVQECFRARLTPKPWRMNEVASLGPPPARFPFDEPATEELYRDWQMKYDDVAPRFATCRLIETHGTSESPPYLAALVKLHDAMTGVERPLPLA
jgi:hypothetical protein